MVSLQDEKYKAQVEKFLAQKEEWVHMYHKKISTRGQNTNNFCESSIRILKDNLVPYEGIQCCSPPTFHSDSPRGIF